MHPHGVFKRYHDYVIFDFNVRVIFEYRISYALIEGVGQWQTLEILTVPLGI
mgnify:CR=1 FL=1